MDGNEHDAWESVKDKGVVQIDPNIYKHVHFEMLPEDEISDSFQINVSVGDIVNKVLLMDDDNTKKT